MEVRQAASGRQEPPGPSELFDAKDLSVEPDGAEPVAQQASDDRGAPGECRCLRQAAHRRRRFVHDSVTASSGRRGERGASRNAYPSLKTNVGSQLAAWASLARAGPNWSCRPSI
jgi:hypothetical protein